MCYDGGIGMQYGEGGRKVGMMGGSINRSVFIYPVCRIFCSFSTILAFWASLKHPKLHSCTCPGNCPSLCVLIWVHMLMLMLRGELIRNERKSEKDCFLLNKSSLQVSSLITKPLFRSSTMYKYYLRLTPAFLSIPSLSTRALQDQFGLVTEGITVYGALLGTLCLKGWSSCVS